MDIETLALAHQKTDDRSIRNEGRIKKLEEARLLLGWSLAPPECEVKS